jgi:mannose/fructose/N-acetylgalactosamine-specific phosphotransferase system component IIB
MPLENKKRIMIIVESMTEASELVRKGLWVKEINVGGIGYREGTREVAPYIYLSTADIESVVYLHSRGIKITGKQLPNSSAVDVVKKLAGIR